MDKQEEDYLAERKRLDWVLSNPGLAQVIALDAACHQIDPRPLIDEAIAERKQDR